MIRSEMQGKTLITNKLNRVLKNIPNIFTAILLFVFSSNSCIAQTGLNEAHKDINSGVQPTLLDPSLVSSFYKLNRQQLFWFSYTESLLSMRKSLIAAIDSAMYLGLDNTGYHAELLLSGAEQSFLPSDSLLSMSTDMIFTDAAISFCKDIYCGSHISSLVNADEISGKFSIELTGRWEEERAV